jgi:hypothetical protein
VRLDGASGRQQVSHGHGSPFGSLALLCQSQTVMRPAHREAHLIFPPWRQVLQNILKKL